MLSINSVNDFGMKEWKSLNSLKDKGSGQFTTANGRTYLFYWNSSGSISVVRDKSTTNIVERFLETLARGFTDSTATRFETRMLELAKKEREDTPLRKTITEAGKQVQRLKQSINSIEGSYQPIEFYPPRPQKTQNEEQVQQCKASNKDIVFNYQSAVEKQKAVLREELTSLRKKLVSLNQLSEFPANASETYQSIQHSMNNLEIEKNALNELKQTHQDVLKLFIVVLNLSSDSVKFFLLPRINGLVQRLSLFLESKQSDQDLKNHKEFLEQQKLVATKLLSPHPKTSCLNGSEEKLKSYLEICSDLLAPPTHSNPKLNDDISLFYQAKSKELVDSLVYDNTSWETIELTMKDVGAVKDALAHQIATAETVSLFLSERNITGKTKLQGHFIELHNLSIQLNSPGLLMESDDQCLLAARLMETIKLGERITQFLNNKNEIAGDRGQHPIMGNYYNEEMQSRINTLQEIEENCKNGKDNPLIQEVETHLTVLRHWGNENEVFSFKIYGRYQHVSSDYTFFKNQNEAFEKERKMQLEAFLQKDQRTQEKFNLLKQIIGKALLQMMNTLLALQHRGEVLKELEPKTEDLKEHSEEFKIKAIRVKNSQTLWGQIKNLVSDFFIWLGQIKNLVSDFFIWLGQIKNLVSDLLSGWVK